MSHLTHLSHSGSLHGQKTHFLHIFESFRARLSCRSQGSHFKQKSQFTRPLLRKFGNLASAASIFTQILAHKPPNLEIFSSQAPKFGNFQLTSPQIWKFSAHKPPLLFRRKCQFASPTLRKSGPHIPT